MAAHELNETARALVADNKGILAADESSGTIEKRFDTIKLESTEESRRAYRDMLFTTPGSGGVRQRRHPLRRDAAPVRVPTGPRSRSCSPTRGSSPGSRSTPAPRTSPARPGEKVTEGLDGLARAAAGVPRARRPLRQVARRDHDRRGHPDGLLHRGQRARARALRGPLPGAGDRADRRARGADGRRQRHRDVLPGDQADAAQGLRRALPPARRPRGDAAEAEHGHLGQGQSPTQASAEEVADWTLRCFRETVPAAVPGIVFLSGGQSDEQASENLNAINSRRAAAVGALVLVRARAAGAGAEGVGRIGGQRRGGAVVPRAACAQQQRRRRGPLLGRDGGAGPLELRIATRRAARGRRSRRRGARTRPAAPSGRPCARLPAPSRAVRLARRRVVLRLPLDLAAHARIGVDQEDARGDLADPVGDRRRCGLVGEDRGREPDIAIDGLKQRGRGPSGRPRRSGIRRLPTRSP